jgi:hypothetical protein
MLATSSNRFLPLQENDGEDKDEEIMMTSKMSEGWEDDMSIPSSDSQSEDRKPSSSLSSKTCSPTKSVKKKKKQLKVKISKASKSIVGSEVGNREVERLFPYSARTSLQSAAVKLGFPMKYLGFQSTLPSFGRGGGLLTDTLGQTIINHQSPGRSGRSHWKPDPSNGLAPSQP